LSYETLAALTAGITANYVAGNRVSTDEIGDVIKSVHGALARLADAPVKGGPEFAPATTARKSLADPAKIVSMIDGKPYAMLKPHLSRNGLTPAEYRARYALPADYPMTAPAYVEKRRMLAKAIGLGRKAGDRIVRTIDILSNVVVPAGVPEREPEAEPARKPQAAEGANDAASDARAPVARPGRKRLGIATAKAAAQEHLGRVSPRPSGGETKGMAEIDEE
jgi:predicted transcriptional regulator